MTRRPASSTSILPDATPLEAGPRTDGAPSRRPVVGAIADESAQPAASRRSNRRPVGRPEHRARRDRRSTRASAIEIAPTAGRLNRLRGRLSRSQNVFGQSPARPARRRDPRRGLLDRRRGHPADGRPRRRRGRGDHRRSCAPRSRRTASPTRAEARALLRRVLIEAVGPDMDRSVRALPHDGRPSVLLSSGSTAPARPPPPASSPGCWSPTAGTWCSAPPTPSAPPPPTSWPPGASGPAPSVVRADAGHRPGVGRVRRGQARHRRRRGRGADRHRRPAAHQDRPDGRARQGQAGRARSRRRSTRSCSCWTPPPARTAWCRRRCSPTSSTSPASC